MIKELEALPHLRDKRGMFIGVEANIGAGKTECAHMLARVRSTHGSPTLVFFEPLEGRFSELLELYYTDPKRWGFTFQMHCLQARFKQHTLAAELVQNGYHIVQDRTIYADGCFGTTVREDGNISDMEWGIYADTFGTLKRYLRYPDLIVYLRCDPAICYERMKRRNRSAEAGVPLEYLRRIHAKHEDLIEVMSHYTRVLRVDWDEFRDVEQLSEQIDVALDEERTFVKDWNRL